VRDVGIGVEYALIIKSRSWEISAWNPNDSAILQASSFAGRMEVGRLGIGG
jgi:hypothetical protein